MLLSQSYALGLFNNNNPFMVTLYKVIIGPLHPLAQSSSASNVVGSRTAASQAMVSLKTITIYNN